MTGLAHKHVVVIGAGMAGMAAATRLAERGIETTLIEAAAHLGGRARSVAIEHNSQVIQLDNGQHIALGAYHETLKLLATVGVQEKDAFLRVRLNLEMRDGRKTAFNLKTPSWLPAPLNQLVGFLTCTGLSWHERVTVMSLMLKLKKDNYRLNDDVQLSTFLQQNQQSSNVIALLWEPLCLAALNTPIKLASSKIFLNVLKDTFENKHNSDFLLPKLDLSQLFSQPIARYLSANQGNVILNQRVKEIKPSDNDYQVVTKEKSVEASHVIIALSPARLRSVLGDLPKLNCIAEQTDDYNYQPIYTIYLQYAYGITLPKPMLGLVGGVCQWVFDRGILCGQNGLMAVIISAQGKHQQYTQDSLALRVAQELRDAFPHLTKPLWHKVIAEKRATFSCNVDLPRPAHITPYPRLYLAGDYTYADYPATIEGAMRSGVACANLIK
ncbi:MAG: FAD-dependent oxidoreductase [Bdellovibrio sp.]|nr:FAD-dependent oxidoreductase [Methylotenera sp.]